MSAHLDSGTSRLARTAIVLTSVTILSCGCLGYMAHRSSRASMTATIARNNLSLARRLGTHALAHLGSSKTGSERSGIRHELEKVWAETEPLFDGSYLCLVKSPGRVTVHTKDPEVVGRYVGDVAIAASGPVSPRTVGELAQARRDWAGVNTNAAGVPQIVGYAYFSELDGFVVVHTPLALVEKDLAAAARPWYIGLAIIGGLLIPLSAGLLHRSYSNARRRALAAETGSQELEHQLFQLQKMEAIGRLAGGIAHDFNNVITAIFGNIELARSRPASEPLDPHTERHLEEIEAAGARAADLTRQLLTFSRKRPIDLQPVDLSLTIRGVENMLNRLIDENVSLVLDIGPAPCLILGNQGFLEQIIVNLVVNARDAMPEGGTIRIETRIVEGTADGVATARLRVEDDGAGMSAEILEKIFEPFFTTKPRTKGSGLGLATVYGIVRNLGGRIDVDSRQGRGTTFTIDFPQFAGVAPAETVEPVGVGENRARTS